MFKALLILSILMIASFLAKSSYAQSIPPQTPTCSCTQSFEDFQGFQSEITVHVICPTAIEEDINCTSKTTNSDFSAICSSIQTGEENVTSTKLDPWSNPVYGYAHCRLN